ncbi:hypothetical protein [Arthrobacter sp. 92]|uniref:hypothetical protein n=1 Tax=Arthrobacter sp. 92 TaxID=3418175 RepID=UPI003D023117
MRSSPGPDAAGPCPHTRAGLRGREAATDSFLPSQRCHSRAKVPPHLGGRGWLQAGQHQANGKTEEILTGDTAPKVEGYFNG